MEPGQIRMEDLPPGLQEKIAKEQGIAASGKGEEKPKEHSKESMLLQVGDFKKLEKGEKFVFLFFNGDTYSVNVGTKSEKDKYDTEVKQKYLDKEQARGIAEKLAREKNVPILRGAIVTRSEQVKRTLRQFSQGAKESAVTLNKFMIEQQRKAQERADQAKLKQSQIKVSKAKPIKVKAKSKAKKRAVVNKISELNW